MAENTTKTITIKINGQDALVQLDEIKKALKETNDSVKQTKETNLGNFTDQLRGLKDAFSNGEIGAKGLATGVLQVSKAMIVAFVTNPVLLAITAIVGAVMLLVNVFKDFKPLVDKIEQAFAALGATWSVLKDGIIQFVSGNKSLADSFTGLGKSMADAAKEAKLLKEAEQNLEDGAKALEVQNAQTETQINKLILQSKNRTITEKERQALITQAMDLEARQHEANLRQANEAERIALDKLTLGKRLSEAELRQLREKGIAYARELQNSKGITDKEIENWGNALIAKEKMLQGSIALQEKGQNRLDQSAEKVKADAEKAAEDAKARREKEKADFEKAFADKDAMRVKEEARLKLIEDSEKRVLETQTAIRQKEREYDSQQITPWEKMKMRKAEKEGIEKSFSEKQAIRDSKLLETHPKQIKQLNEWREHLVQFDTFETIMAKTKLERERNVSLETFSLQVSLVEEDRKAAEKKRDNEIKIAKETFKELSSQAGLDVKDKLKLQLDLDAKLKQSNTEYEIAVKDSKNRLDIINSDYYLKLAEYENRKTAIAQENLKENATNQINSNEIIIESEEETYNKRQFILQQHMKLLDKLFLYGAITEQELFNAKEYYSKKAVKLQQEETAQRMQAAADMINYLADTDKKATETSINFQKTKLLNHQISQEEYDKKVAEIQLKAAKREKAYAVASTIISTAQAIVGMLTVKPVTPINFALAAAAGILGAAQIAAIVSTPLGEDGSGNVPSANVSTPSTSQGTAPNTSFSFSKAPGTIDKEPIRTYVLSKDVTYVQQMDRQIVTNGSI